MKAITTKFLPCTATKGARIRAFDMDGNAAVISYPSVAHGEDAHALAAAALISKMKWTGRIQGGAVKGGYVFVFLD